ncbi:188_t:CDS:2, partial [Paraglomus occultum]
DPLPSLPSTYALSSYASIQTTAIATQPCLDKCVFNDSLSTGNMTTEIVGGSDRIREKENEDKRLDNNRLITNDALKNGNQESNEQEDYVMSHYDKPFKDIPSLLPSSSYSSPSSQSSDLSDLKERFNYASRVCAAMILNTNKGARFAHAILTEDKDQYMLNEYDSEKFVVVELCDDILIDTIVLANFEFFSSTFQHIRISVNNEYPPRKEKPWRLLGEYKAEETRELQVFKVKDPLLWARYIHIDFVSHYGHQVYCPVSLLRVHGVTMIEDYKRQEEQSSTPSASDTTTRINKTEEVTLKMIDEKLSGESERKDGKEEKSDIDNRKNDGQSSGNNLGNHDSTREMDNKIRDEVDKETNSVECNLHGDDSVLLHTLFGSDSQSMLQCPRIYDEKDIFSNPFCEVTDDPYYLMSVLDKAQRMLDNQYMCLKDQCGLYEENDLNAMMTTSPSLSLSTPLCSTSPLRSPQISSPSVYQKFLKRFADLESQTKILREVLNKVQAQQVQMLDFMVELSHNVTGLNRRLEAVELIIKEYLVNRTQV